MGVFDKYNIVLISPEGKPCKLTRYNETKNSRADDVVSSSLVRIKPGMADRDLLCINKYFDMSLEGKYSLIVSRSVVIGNDQIVISSDKVQDCS